MLAPPPLCLSLRTRKPRTETHKTRSRAPSKIAGCRIESLFAPRNILPSRLLWLALALARRGPQKSFASLFESVDCKSVGYTTCAPERAASQPAQPGIRSGSLCSYFLRSFRFSPFLFASFRFFSLLFAPFCRFSPLRRFCSRPSAFPESRPAARPSEPFLIGLFKVIYRVSLLPRSRPLHRHRRNRRLAFICEIVYLMKTRTSADLRATLASLQLSK